ncbi:MAG: lysostaphin resistance A-like protein [Candidatus Odinarchaeota archaeon]
MVIEDPNILEEEDQQQGIEIYEPGAFIESSIESSKLTNILFVVLAGWILMFIAQIVIMIPLLLTIGLYEILTDPWALLIMTIAEVGFVVPPIWYVKKQRISIKSLGVKNLMSIKDVVLGLIFGSLMVSANIIISWFMTLVIPSLGEGDSAIFYPPTDGGLYIWFALWIFAMFVFVGFTEELMFRGFLQRRLEIIYRTKQSKNFKLIALVVTSFIFAIVHLDLIGLPTRFVLGMFLGYLAQKRNYSLLGPTVAHGFNNSLVVILAVLIP